MGALRRIGEERRASRALSVFVRRSEGVLMEEAMRRAWKSGLVIASNKRLGDSLARSGGWQAINEVFTSWSGTLVAYEKPGQKLGMIIWHTDPETGIRYIFPVPDEHRGERNVILVANHPGFFFIKDGSDRVVMASHVRAVEDFPVSNGWYRGDPFYDIPRGGEVNSETPGARYLWRIGRRVGLASRGYYRFGDYHYGMRDVYLDDPPGVLGVAVECRGKREIKVKKEDGRLIVEGSPEKIAAAARLLERLA